jgi:hypothetical protein
MKKSTNGRSVFLATVVLVGISGCGPKIQFVEVNGVVKLNGAPMADALVEFLPDPDKGTEGPRSSGKTDAEGRFRLQRDDDQFGAVVGFHRVLVQDMRTFPPPRDQHKGGVPPVMPLSRIANQYENASRTPLRQEIKAEPGPIVIDVKSR